MAQPNTHLIKSSTLFYMYADDLNLLINNNVLIIVNDVSADEVINILILLLRLI